ncbi:hypothetical protein PAAG_08422 [Paracoccidioides lutzii Pb01]|uniref:DNA endonuclease activator Ctp1 C-terminal domain-containing protein n=1 Tax=Paracoccidioides lutzii (strain ATCC MYA-826 / Pb01) TaxID=502779 RepID=C1HCD1_PARBA|nr:hypothetical protein PAAG_08422 [Paracoccidioides lutzii Pb01]EEH38695.1 hypothetical protein PAAG_08422 [Paracoccidioides lutzii Pb01]
MEEHDFCTLAEQVGQLVNQCRQWKQGNAELEEKLKHRDSRIIALETENADLERYLENLESNDAVDGLEKRLLDNRQQYAPNMVLHESVGKTEKPVTISYEYYASLAKRYEQLFQENASLIKSFFTVKRKLKNCKDKVSFRNTCFERDSFDVHVRGKRVVFQRVDEITSRVPQNQRHHGQVEEASTTGLATIGRADQIPEPRPHEMATGIEREAIGISDGALEPGSLPLLSSNSRARGIPEELTNQHSSGPTSSDITPTQTQDPRYADEPCMFLSSSPSGSPIFVSERPVRVSARRNCEQPAPSAGTKPLEMGSFTRSVAAKSEPTPRSPLQTMQGTTDDDDDDCLDPSTCETNDIDIGSTNHINPPPLKPPRTKFAVLEEREAVKVEQIDLDGLQIIGTKRRLALQPVNCNISSLRQSHGYTKDQETKRSRYNPKGADAVHLVTEDGEKMSHSKTKTRPATDQLRENARIKNAVCPTTSCLEDPFLGDQSWFRPVLNSPFRIPETMEKLPPGTPSKVSSSSVTPRCSRPQTVEKRNSSSRQRPPPPPRRNLRLSALPQPRDDDEISPESEPFRARPLHRLGFEHFRLNPERNQGLDYAFDEVVRRKDLRKCLPGCIRPECCGKGFRAMAKLKRFGEQTADEKEDLSLEYLDREDRNVLDEYLGDKKVVLESMTNKELQELLLDARTRHLANQFGKHRYVHERARSPPGFWRTDMPSTQELERDWQEARKAEQEKLAERYREAMRPGGLWRFADE